MSNIAIRVENLSKLYPAVAPRARRLGRAQQRHDTLRGALASAFRHQGTGARRQTPGSGPLTPGPRPLAPEGTDLWALKDVSFDVKQGEVVGTLAPAVAPWCQWHQGVARRASTGVPSTELRAAPLWGRTGIGRNGAGKSTLLKLLSRITEPTSGRAEIDFW